MWSKKRREERKFQAKGMMYAKALTGSAEGAFDEHKDQRIWSIEYDVEEVPGATIIFLLGCVIHFDLYVKTMGNHYTVLSKGLASRDWLFRKSCWLQSCRGDGRKGQMDSGRKVWRFG